jgi:importin-9
MFPFGNCQDLLMALCEEFEEECCVSLAQTIERHLREAGEARAAGNQSWWKIHEATMLALGSAQEVIEQQIKVESVVDC